MLTVGGRAPPFGDLAKCATAAGADVDAGVQRANLFAGGWWACGHLLPQASYLPCRKIAVTVMIQGLCSGWAFRYALPMTEAKAGLPIIPFANAAAFETWIVAQRNDAAGLWLKLAKQDSGIASLSKADAIDVALCHGWIDGQLDKYDDRFWLVRFTLRRHRSKWSEVNRTRALELIEAGRMRLAGLVQIEAAKNDGRWDAAYAPASRAEVPPDLQAALDANVKAATFLATLTGANRYAILYRIGAVKRAETRARKIVSFVAMLERGETLHG